MKKYLKEKTDLVEVFSIQLMAKKDKLEELQNVIHKFLNFTHDTDIIKQWSTLQTQIADTLAIRVAYCEWKTPVLLDGSGSSSLTALMFLTVFSLAKPPCQEVINILLINVCKFCISYLHLKSDGVCPKIKCLNCFG